jgi:Eco29kI-like restriction endonuclease
MSDEPPYNPLDTRNLGKSVAEALLDRDDHAISDIPRFVGSGIYVIYYLGDYELYRPMAEVNAEELSWPIYVGKAVPSGGRRGTNLFQPSTGTALFGRLAEHRESIEQAENLDVADFRVRYLIVDDIWIPLGESLLISTFKPVWNAMLDGFGNHDPGSGRYNGERPLWDMVHPGRYWAPRLRERQETPELIGARVTEYLERHPPPRDAHMKFTP